MSSPLHSALILSHTSGESLHPSLQDVFVLDSSCCDKAKGPWHKFSADACMLLWDDCLYVPCSASLQQAPSLQDPLPPQLLTGFCGQPARATVQIQYARIPPGKPAPRQDYTYSAMYRYIKATEPRNCHLLTLMQHIGTLQALWCRCCMLSPCAGMWQHSQPDVVALRQGHGHNFHPTAPRQVGKLFLMTQAPGSYSTAALA